MTYAEDDDYWTGLSASSSKIGKRSAALHISFLSRDEAVGDAVPVALEAALPDAPSDVLMALYGPGAPQHVHLLVDCSLRTEVAGLFDLDVIDAPARSLFQGEAEETMGEAGPWLVNLSLPDPEHPADVYVLRDLFSRHWPAGFSILVSTDAPFDVVRGHLRRFIKRPVLDDGRTLTFRFWDPRILGRFLTSIATDRSRARRMAATGDGIPITYLLPVFADMSADVSAIRIAPDDTLPSEPLRPMRLRYADFDTIAEAHESARRDRITDRLCADFEAELAHRPSTDVRAAVDAALDRFGAFGFRAHAHLHLFAAWSLFYGPAFERSDPTGELYAILRSKAPEAERFAAFRRRFETFTLGAEA